MKRLQRDMPNSLTSRFRDYMATTPMLRLNTDADLYEYPNPNVRIQSVFQPNFAEINQNLGQKQDPLIEIIEAKHPYWEENHNLWKDWFNWYSGKNIKDYIYRHHREPQESYKRRQERAYYYNYTQEIVDLIASFIYSKPITRSFFRESENLALQEHIEKNDFWSNCDLKNSKIDAFMEKVQILTQIFGFLDVVVDMPILPEEIQNEQERLDAQIRPYIYYVLPEQMINWECDDKGEFVWVRWRERADKQDNPFQARGNTKVYKYYTWTRKEWFIHRIEETKRRKKTISLLGQGAHDLGVVPVVRFFGKKDLVNSNLGQSFVEQIGKINIAICNCVSLLEEEIYSKIFNILAMEDPDSSFGNETSDGAATGIKIGNNNALLWSGQHPPFYLAPATSPGEFIMDWIRKSTDEIYKLATLWTDTGIRESRSGVSYSYEFNRTNAMLADRAELLQEGEKKLHTLYCIWLGEEWNGIIDYPDSYDVEVLDQELQTITSAKKAVRSDTFAKELEKRIVLKVLSNSPTETIEKIMNEIDSTSDSEDEAEEKEPEDIMDQNDGDKE